MLCAGTLTSYVRCREKRELRYTRRTRPLPLHYFLIVYFDVHIHGKNVFVSALSAKVVPSGHEWGMKARQPASIQKL